MKVWAFRAVVYVQREGGGGEAVQGVAGGDEGGVGGEIVVD